MTEQLPANRAFARRTAIVAALVLAFGGAPAIAAETCAWTHTGSGADFGSCIEAGGRVYCVTCQYSPRVCVRTAC